MSDFFDQWVDRLASRSPQVRHRRLIASAAITLFLAVGTVVWMIIYPITLTVPAQGEVMGVDLDTRVGRVRLEVESRFGELIDLGQVVRVADGKEEWRVTSVDDDAATDRFYIEAEGFTDNTKQWRSGAKIWKAAIVYKRVPLFNLLLPRRFAP